jgi:geranylgeranyl diphosphate synthase type II
MIELSAMSKMLQRTLEGQALEVVIRDNVSLDYSDYYQLCLKKTAWYTTIFLPG